MYCKNCGKQISDNSSFCNYCGANQGDISPTRNEQSQKGLNWESKTLTIPNDKFEHRYTLQLVGAFPNARELISLWQSYKPQIPELLITEMNEGWEIDPNFFDETCIEYTIRRADFSDIGTVQKILLGFMCILTFGIGLLLLPLIGATKVLQPTGVKIRLRKLLI